VGEVTLEDLSNMYARILPQLYSSYCWVIHPSVVPQILQLADLAGRIVFLPDRSVVGAPNWQIFGLPVMISDNAALLGQAADVCLVARDIYAIGLNKNIQIAASTDYQFGSDIVTYRCAVRVCGNPLLTSKVLLKDGSYQVGWAITLKATTS
jgi:HK97 family phage major capsid protein